MSELVLAAAERYPNNAAYSFLGEKTTYREFARKIRECALALARVGIKSGERVMICLPNTPQAVILFYAINFIGATAQMVHPLCAPEELVFYLQAGRSVAAFTLGRFMPKFMSARAEAFGSVLKAIYVTDMSDGMRFARRTLYRAAARAGLAKGAVLDMCGAKRWRFVRSYDEFIARARRPGPAAQQARGGAAAILYSGGTTGTPKGILLTDLNFNALAMQTAKAGACIVPGHKMLAILPVFHGFGLGICIHTALISGVTAILVPQFSVRSYAKLLRRHRPHYIAGVPTLFEALLRMRRIWGLNMSQMEGVFSGGDTLSPELRERVNAFLRAHGASVQIREGYGLTECVTASCLTPRDFHRDGSIGKPYPDTLYKIVEPNTDRELDFGQTGEICISGPTVMAGYDGAPEETALVLRAHPDGRVWLHTGDLGCMDGDSFVYFRQRLKRVIMSSGYSIYPSQLEDAINRHPDVEACCVVGVPDDYRIQRPKAFIVLRGGAAPTDRQKDGIMEHCRKSIAKYAMPCEIEYRAELPKTGLGKIAYAQVEREELARRRGERNDEK
jgi:long-chain acyl-CoA synthetase